MQDTKNYESPKALIRPNVIFLTAYAVPCYSEVISRKIHSWCREMSAVFSGAHFVKSEIG